MPRWTVEDIADQSGRTAIVTGANSGLGFETAAALAAAGARVVLAVRNPERGNDAIDRIRGRVPAAEVELQLLDLSSLADVRDAAAKVKAAHPRIDLLINNAGVMYPPRQVTADGFELQFGTNHLGHFAFTGLLLECLLPVPNSRVVTVSSFGHRVRADIRFDDLQFSRGYDRVAAYGQSKLANLLFAYELQRRLPTAPGATISVAAHPGAADTDLMRHLPAVLRGPATGLAFQSAAMGALPTLRAATDPVVQGGRYYGPGGPLGLRGYPELATSSRNSHDPALARRLWQVSEKLTGVSYPFL